MDEISRRDVLVVAGVTASLPVIQSMLGGMCGCENSAHAAEAKENPDAPPEPPAAGGGWVTAVKPADLKDKTFKQVDKQTIVLARNGKTVQALSMRCTHKNCKVTVQEGSPSLLCKCHNAKFGLAGEVEKGPAKLPLPRYALRLNKDGVIEVDTSKTIAADAKEATLTVE